MFAKCKVGNICYYVKDIVKTEEFYRGTLGLAVDNMGDDGQGHDFLIAHTAGGIDLLFFQMEGTAGSSPIIVFEMAEGGIDAAVDGLAQAGATIVTPVSHAPGGWSAEFADPDGHVLSMYQDESLPR
jgi:predicted enzyme related to lactoylglutathione lyase